MAIQIQYRRDLAATWTSVNPILAEGEPGYETDTGKFKVGNGVDNWSTLTYSSGPAGVAGVDGATGATGTTGAGVPVGGTTGQVLAKTDGTDYNTQWITPSGGSSAVTSVNSQTGAIVLTFSDVGAEPANATILKSATIGVTVQGYNANTVVDASYVHTDNNYTTVEKSKLSGIASGAEINVNADWNSITGDSQILNKPTLGTAAAANTTDFASSGSNTNITSIALTTGTISTTPSSSTDIINKSYADSIVSGVNFHPAVNNATTTALPANTYSNGVSGVGATLTAVVNGALTVDGTLQTINKRILVKNEVLPANNGVYIVTQVGSGVLPYILTRATDYDSSGSGTNEIDAGDMLLVLNGTLNPNTSWVQQTPLPITIGTTDIVFIEFAKTQTYTAGTGLTLSTNQFSITNAGTAGTYGSATLIPIITTNSQGQVTSVTTATNPQGTVTSVGGTGTVSGLSLSGTVTSTGNLTLGGTLSATASNISDFSTAADSRIGAASINALSDVVVSTPALNQVLTYNGTNWINQDPAGGGGSFAGGTLTSSLILATGTTTAGTAPLYMTSGTSLTTAAAGAIEYDGNTPYFSIAASTRGVMPTEQIVVLTGTNTLTSQTAVQPIFDGGGGPTNGSVTLPIGTYQYECSFAATGLSATSGSFGFALGGAATKTYTYQAQASKAGTALTTPMATVSTFGSAAITTLVANSTGTVANLLVKGIIRVTVAGTVIPQVSLTVASAAVVQASSYFKVSPLGNVSTVATVGNWA